MSEAQTAIIQAPAERAALALNSTKTEADLRTLVASSADITTVVDMDGREQAHRIAMTLRTHRTTIEKTGKAARDDATKFSKAVIAEEDRLIAIIAPEEKRVLGLRDAWDAEQARIQAEKVAKERARMDTHEAALAAIVRIPADMAGKNAAYVLGFRNMCADTKPGDEWEEYRERAIAAYASVVEQLDELHSTKLAAEDAARREAEEREAERQRIAAEQAELARLRAEQEAAAARLAEQQRQLEEQRLAMEAEMQRKRDEEAAKARAEEQERQRQADEAAAALRKQADELAAQRAAFEAEQAAARKAKEDAEELERAHAEALEINERGHYFSTTTFRDDGTPIMLNPNGTRSIFCDVDEEIEDAETNEATEAAAPEGFDIADAYTSEVEPTDEEIVSAFVETFGGTPAQAIERLARFAAQYQIV